MIGDWESVFLPLPRITHSSKEYSSRKKCVAFVPFLTLSVINHPSRPSSEREEASIEGASASARERPAIWTKDVPGASHVKRRQYK